ncbi:MAG: hypothetical protein HC800_20270 [Phormidesmis sp. RL_2_1]|nr:hypothetical protein [Phormidesmis sp. RL_2_1]
MAQPRECIRRLFIDVYRSAIQILEPYLQGWMRSPKKRALWFLSVSVSRCRFDGVTQKAPDQTGHTKGQQPPMRRASCCRVYQVAKITACGYVFFYPFP